MTTEHRSRKAVSPLALEGGSPVRSSPWPAWPRLTVAAEQELLRAARSGRWTVSGAYTGKEPYERRFADAFADFQGVRHCVPTCHGSSALVVALEALGVGPGDEVLVPGLTWVACASAVAGVGALPVLVDIDPRTLCISVDAAEAALTERTAAIMLVHLFCSAADLDRFEELSRARGVPLLEDCSQAHGAVWRGRRVGSYGTVAAFSFQQTKLLTSGEGGAVLTDDPHLAQRMEELRADGRRYTAQPRIGQLDLEEVGAVQGRNYCLSELHAALLAEGLDRLDEENAIRRDNASRLRTYLDDIKGVEIIDQPPQLDEPAYYHLCLRLEPERFGVASVDPIAEAMTAELGVHVEPVDRPLNDNPLYDPRRSSRSGRGDHAALDPTQFDLPAAAEARRTCITLPHRVLLGAAPEVESIVQAIEKVQVHTRHAGYSPNRPISS